MIPPIRILVVEDERITALNMQRQLTKLGYEVPACVASGHAALESIAELKPDLVLMDIHIEGDIDGIETAALIRAGDGTPVVYLTAYSEDATLERARQTQPFGYLIKPFSERELHSTIQMALERRKVEVHAQASEARLRLALDAANMGTWEVDPVSGRVQCSARTDELFGVNPQAFDGTWFGLLARVSPDDARRVASVMKSAVEFGGAFETEFRVGSAGSDERWLRAQGRSVEPVNRAAPRMIGVVQDITRHHSTDRRLREAAAMLEAMGEGVFSVTLDGRIGRVNKAFADMTGHRADTLPGRRLPELVDVEGAAVLTQAFHVLEAAGRWRGECPGLVRAGSGLTGRLTIEAVRDEAGVCTHFIGVLVDVSALRNAQLRLQDLAHHDALTGLPNRLLFNDRLAQALRRCARDESRVALLFIDLDHFKSVNDNHGHAVGDELLVAMARRMQKALRGADTLARLAGDEFVVIAEFKSPGNGMTVLAERMMAATTGTVQLGKHVLSVSSSVGVAIAPTDGMTADALLSAADTAMYESKRRGPGHCTHFTAEMGARRSDPTAAEHDQRRDARQRDRRER